MPQSDILNPTPRHFLNPDYSYARKRPLTHLNQKANRGVPFFRDITDVGHQFLLSWQDRPVEAADKLKWYYEQYRDGFFTWVDHEGGGRHYVGRFSTDVEPMPTAHNHWDIQMVTFDEIPGVPMLKYPHRWDKDAVWALLMNDFGDVMVQTSGSWTLTAEAGSVSGYRFYGANNTPTDFAAYQYYGYGFQFWSRNGAGLGIGALSLDGTALDNIDFYSASSTGAALKMWEQLDVPLGLHVVTLTATNTKNASASGMLIPWDALMVMR